MPTTTLRADVLDALNSAQRAAACHGLAQVSSPPPLLVIAGAGSGKTLTLATRVALLVLAGTDPQRILMVTFSRRAAQAMQRRVSRLLHEALGLPGSSAPPQLAWCGTFHSVAARLLRLHASNLGLAQDFTVLDHADSEELMGLARQQLDLHASTMRFPLAATCLAMHSRVQGSHQPLRELVEREYPWCDQHVDALKALFATYTQLKLAQHLLDFDDLLLYWQAMLDEPTLAARLRARFEHVLVDEYQDTNALQQAIVRGLCPDGQGLVVVGDDAQAIYSFRGANACGILDFPATFTPAAQRITLEQNYRSTPQILAAANAVIALAQEGFPKTLFSERVAGARPSLVNVLDEAAEAAWVADEVLRRREEGLALKQQAVLFRTASHSAALELELSRRRIPFVKYGGLRFLEAAHIKDLLSLLRWVQNPRGLLAGVRVARLVPGIGPAIARRVAETMSAGDDPLRLLQTFSPPPRAAEEWGALVATYTALSATDAPWPSAIDDAVHWYLPHLKRLHDDARVREADLRQLCALAAGYGSLERFLTELTLDPPQATGDEAADPLIDEDYLILSTIHSAKGQEWHAVSVLKVVDGCMPSDMATGSAAEIEEERRLLYVAMTRARDHLNLMLPQRFHVTQQRHHGDRHLYGNLTRFITPEVAQCFDMMGPAVPLLDDGAAAGGGVVLDMAARAMQRWR